MGIEALEIDWKAFGMVCILLALFYLFRNTRVSRQAPTLFFSTLTPFKAIPKGIKTRWAWLPEYLAYAALIFFLLAFIDPRLFLPRPINPNSVSLESTEGIAIYLVLDQSGSMNEPVAGNPNETKIQLLKQLTADFIAGRPNDLLGLVFFARVPLIVAPLTLDHASLLGPLGKLEVVKDKTHDGTAIGYAIYKIASLIAATRHFAENMPKEDRHYDIKSAIMVLVTDGVQEINPLDNGNPLRTIDIPEAAAFAKQQDVRVYIVNIDPSISNEEFAPFRYQMRKATELTGGQFFTMASPDQLGNIYEEINRLEKSRLPNPILSSSLSKENLPYLYHRFPLYPYFIFAGLICLLFSIILKSTLLKKMP